MHIKSVVKKWSTHGGNWGWGEIGLLLQHVLQLWDTDLNNGNYLKPTTAHPPPQRFWCAYPVHDGSPASLISVCHASLGNTLPVWICCWFDILLKERGRFSADQFLFSFSQSRLKTLKTAVKIIAATVGGQRKMGRLLFLPCLTELISLGPFGAIYSPGIYYLFVAGRGPDWMDWFAWGQ